MAIGCRVCRVCAVQAGSQPRSCRPRQGGWGPLPEPPTDPALTSRSDMGVLSSSGRCCSSARTMQFAMMVAKIMYSKGVRPSQGKPSWAEPAGAWGPPQTRLVGETEAGEGPVGCPKGRGVWDPPAPAAVGGRDAGPAATSAHVLRGSLISPSKARPGGPGSSARSLLPGGSRRRSKRLGNSGTRGDLHGTRPAPPAPKQGCRPRAVPLPGHIHILGSAFGKRIPYPSQWCQGAVAAGAGGWQRWQLSMGWGRRGGFETPRPAALWQALRHITWPPTGTPRLCRQTRGASGCCSPGAHQQSCPMTRAEGSAEVTPAATTDTKMGPDPAPHPSAAQPRCGERPLALLPDAAQLSGMAIQHGTAIRPGTAIWHGTAIQQGYPA